MELGLTFPLQRFLKVKTPAYGTQPDRRFCWDLHVIELRGRKSLLAVHCHSRYTFVRYDVSPLQWADLPGLFREGLWESLTAAGFPQARAEEYLQRARTFFITRTHGRREVAFLNRAWRTCWPWTCAWTPPVRPSPCWTAPSTPGPAAAWGLKGWEQALPGWLEH